ncbi:threonine synthase, partial [Candidatus Woesearchaeota archaeon]
LIIPVGNAGNISAYWKGFNELVILGMAESKPHMIGVQAEGAKPIVNAFNSGASIIKPLSQVETVATAIRIGNPVNWRRALNAIRESGGLAEAVSDDEILEAQRLLASKEGIFVEPASAAPIAYLIKAMNEGSLIERDDKVVCIATGHGLKDPQIAIKQSSKPIEVDANIDEVEKVLGKVL